jgi:hypothetical protein
MMHGTTKNNILEKNNFSVTRIQRNRKERKVFPLQAGSISHKYLKVGSSGRLTHSAKDRLPFHASFTLLFRLEWGIIVRNV